MSVSMKQFEEVTKAVCRNDEGLIRSVFEMTTALLGKDGWSIRPHGSFEYYYMKAFKNNAKFHTEYRGLDMTTFLNTLSKAFECVIESRKREVEE